jgi:tRNA(fMet)-specific endonuclease VapC
MKVGEFLLDTNIVIGLLIEAPEIVRRFDAEGTAALSAIALGELYYGAYNSKQLRGNLAKLEHLLLSITLLDCDLNTALIYGELKQYLRTIGKPIPDNDLRIAAQCKQHGLTLVTRDAHFSQLPDLNCENW